MIVGVPSELGIAPKRKQPHRRHSYGLFGLDNAVSDAAMKEYIASYKRAEAELSYLANATASTWETRVNDALYLVPNEFKSFESMVRGKTGDPEAEQKLSLLWGTVSQKAIEMNANKPGVIAQLADKTSIFFTDFWDGVKQAQKDYSEWAIKKAGPALEKYHDARNWVVELKKNLAELQTKGLPTDVIRMQQEKISDAEGTLNKIKSTFATISGGLDLDQLAQVEYGAYLSWPPLPIIAAVAIAVTATLIVVGAGAILSVNKLAVKGQEIVQETRNAFIADLQKNIDKYLPWIIGGGLLTVAGVAGAIVYYKYYYKKTL
jgi:hypothetical protein